MNTGVLELPKGACAAPEIGSLGAFFDATPEQDSSLPRNDERLVNALVSALDRYLLSAAGSRSASELQSVRKKVWPKYIRGLRALQDTVANLIPEHLLTRITTDAIAGLEGDLQKRGDALLGLALKDQAMFTLWTLGNIRSLGREISAHGDVAPEKQKADQELMSEYIVNSLWAQFHLDAIAAAVKFNQCVAEDIRESLLEGLRAAVNAYAIMMDALALRRPLTVSDPVSGLPWDDEDEKLLASSMRDINADFTSGS
jgi:hypothetical protein